MRAVPVILAISWMNLWITPEQQAYRKFQRQEFADAATQFSDPMWQGTAWYRAGEFEKAAQAFARRSTPEASFNEGNSRLMLGKYDDAIKCYDRALQARPAWKEAEENRTLAQARAKLVDHQGGDMGDQEIGADEVVFDKQKSSEGQDTEVAGAETVSDQTMQAIWLRRVQTDPADFLRRKFKYQLATEATGEQP